MNENYLLITLTVRDGEFEHTHRCLYESTEPVEKAVHEYAKNFWGEGEYDPKSNNFLVIENGYMIISIDHYTVLTKTEYVLLSQLFNRN